jgi:hypothetical protein
MRFLLYRFDDESLPIPQLSPEPREAMGKGYAASAGEDWMGARTTSRRRVEQDSAKLLAVRQPLREIPRRLEDLEFQ